MPPVKPQQLTVLVGERTGVLYSPPNPDGSSKQCGNCALWPIVQVPNTLKLVQ